MAVNAKHSKISSLSKEARQPLKWISYFWPKILKKLNLDSSPLSSHTFLDFLLINASLSSIIKRYTPWPRREGEASLKIFVIDYTLLKFNPYLLLLSFPKLSWADSQPFSAYSHHNTNIHHLAYTFLLHKRLITNQDSYSLWNPWFVYYFAHVLAFLKLTTHHF